MTKLLMYSVMFCLMWCACQEEPKQATADKWKEEIRDTERRFAEMVGAEGIHKGFMAFAAEDAVLMRNDKLIISKGAIDSFYQNRTAKGLVWSPDFIEVATSGDLAYTYGHYTFSQVDSSGQTLETRGVFHTVWKRQSDGSWKFVWD